MTRPGLFEEYQKYAVYASKQERLRMGYPLTGSVAGHFEGDVWVKSSADSERKFIDLRLLGVKPGSIADAFLLNIGDPESSLEDEGSRRARGVYYPEDIENEVLNILTRYFREEPGSTKGYVSSGCTEANLACMWWLRSHLSNLAKARFKKELISITESHFPTVYASKQSHYSCAKICQILDLDLVKVDTTISGEVDITLLSNLLSEHVKSHPGKPFIVWLNAGTTVLGAIDNFIEIRNFLNGIKSDLFAVHTDGAVLGVALPILRPEYAHLFRYTDTLAISGHKLLATNSACGVALTKRAIIASAFADKDINIGYVHDIKDITITGGRSSLPIFQLHLSLKVLGLDNDCSTFRKIINQNLKNALYLTQELIKIIGKKHVFYGARQFNIVFTLLMDSKDAELLKEKYTLMPLANNKACVSVFLNVDIHLINSFLTDYKTFHEKHLKEIEEINFRPRL